MKTNERELRQAFRDYIDGNSRTLEKGCPPAAAIWGLFTAKNSARRRAKMMDHITSCPFCLREFDAFLEISRAEGKLIREVQSRFPSERPKPAFPLVWRYVTAFLLLIVGLTAAMFTTRWFGLGRKPEERGRLSGQLRLLDPGRETSLRLPLVFRWERIPGAESYVVEIFDDSLLPFWKSPQLKDDSYELPVSIKGKMENGKSYFWMLTAFSQGGIRTESSLEEFRCVN